MILAAGACLVPAIGSIVENGRTSGELGALGLGLLFAAANALRAGVRTGRSPQPSEQLVLGGVFGATFVMLGAGSLALAATRGWLSPPMIAISALPLVLGLVLAFAFERATRPRAGGA